MADQKLTALTEDTTPTSDDLVYTVTDPAGTPASRKATLRNIQLAGSAVQMVSTISTASATGTTVLPVDNTIPQNTEGDEYMTRAITPIATTNRLVIDVRVMMSASIANYIAIALFQDTTAGALAATAVYGATATGLYHLTLQYDMAAGTTSATTFKVRAGVNGAGTTTFNGGGGIGNYFSTVAKSSIVITEYKA